MTNRWQVRVHQSHTNGSKCPKCRWVVDPPGFDYKRRARHTGDWTRAGGKWFQWGKWDRGLTKREAWQEALAYADQMSRTVEVELTTPVINTGTIRTRLSGDGLLIEFNTPAGWHGIRAANDELKPLALALLAHARKEQGND